MFEVSNWVLKVFEQEKKEKCVLINTSKSGKKTETGYEKSMPIRVVVTDTTDWPHENLSGKVIDVDGRFSHTEYTDKNGNRQLAFTIFADKITEHVWENTNSQPTNENW